MAVSIQDFWRLVLESQLLTQAQCQQLATSFGSSQGASTDTQALAKWLIEQNVISRYQATVLLAGRPGPFCYGEYKIYDRIESGRLAGWFRAVHIATNHPVMLKFLTGAASQDAALWQYIVSFVPLTNHPNLVRVYQAVDLGAYKFLVTEDLRGQSLAERLQTSGAVPADEACRVAQLAANGLGHLHQTGRPHGDARPYQFWLETTGNVKLLAEPDAAVPPPNFSQADSNGELLARSEYFAPEFLQPGKTQDHLTDIYALGCSLYELIAARPPFAGGTVLEKMQRHAAEGIQPLDSVGAPQAIGQAVAYMMAKNPQVRYQQTADVVQQLGQFVGAAQANYKPDAAPATLPAYESALAQKQQAAAVAVAQPAAVAVAQPIATAVQPVTTAVQPVLAAQPAAATPVVNTKTPPAPSKKRPSRSVESVTAERQARAQARQRNQIIMFGSAIGVAAVILMIGIIVMSSTGGDDPPDDGKQIAVVDPDVPEVDPGEVEKQGSLDKGKQPPETDEDSVAVVDDDGKLLWASPTAGQPIELKYVPAEARIFVVLRPAEMLGEPEGERVLQALGPDFVAARTAWEAAAGMSLSDVDRLTLTVHPNGGQFPQVCSIVYLANAVGRDALLSKWGNPPAVEGLANVFEKGGTAYYIPSDGNEQVFVMGPLESEIRDLVGGELPPMSRDLGRLLKASDDQRHVNIIFDRNFLRSSGSPMFGGSRARAAEQIDWFLGTGVKAGLVSLHFSDPFYFEFRAQNDVTVDSQTLAVNLRERADCIPQAIEDYMVKVNPPAYWAKVKGRINNMVYEWQAHTRSGVDMDHAMLNSALPAVAASNLAVAGEMLIALAPGAGPVGVASTGPSPPKTIEEVLTRKISLAFPELDFNLAAKEAQDTVTTDYRGMPFEFKITILGGDLQTDGVTRNQKIVDFNVDGTVAEVLTAMVINADKKDKRVVWVIAPDPENASNKIILITTRKAAEGKYTLPAVFAPK